MPHMYKYEKTTRSPAVGVTSSCEPLERGGHNWIQLWSSKSAAGVLNHGAISGYIPLLLIVAHW